MKNTEKELHNAIKFATLHSSPSPHVEERIFKSVAPKRRRNWTKGQFALASAVMVLFFAGGITTATMSDLFQWNKMKYQAHETGIVRENVLTPIEILQQSIDQGKQTYDLKEANSVADFKILRPNKEVLPLKKSLGVTTDNPPEGYYPATFIYWDVFEKGRNKVYVAQYHNTIKTAIAKGESTNDIESHYFGYDPVSLSDQAVGFVSIGESSIKGYRKLHVEYLTPDKQVIHLVFYATIGKKDLISFAKEYIKA